MAQELDAVSAAPGLGGAVRRASRSAAPYLSFLPFMRNQRREGLEDKVEFCCECRRRCDARHGWATVNCHQSLVELLFPVLFVGKTSQRDARNMVARSLSSRRVCAISATGHLGKGANMQFVVVHGTTMI